MTALTEWGYEPSGVEATLTATGQRRLRQSRLIPALRRLKPTGPRR